MTQPMIGGVKAVFVFLGSLAFPTTGFFIVGTSSRQESATTIANPTAFPMLFLYGAFVPLDPVWSQDMAKMLPN